MSTALRSLLAIFEVDTGGAQAGLKQLDAKIAGTGEVLADLAKTVVAAFSAHAIADFVGSMIELGSQLNDTSEKLGVGTDELQKFQYAAQLSGVGSEEAAHGLQFLNKAMGEALAGGQDAVKQFADLGVALKDSDGSVRELGDVVPDLADAFEKMGSDQERTAAAMKLFGRSGAQLIPLLKKGSGELRQMNEQFDELGLGISKDFIEKADAAGDALDTLKFGFRSLKTVIAGQVLPYVKQFSQTASKWVANAIDIAKTTNVVKEGWAGLGVLSVITGAKMAKTWGKSLGLFKDGAGFLQNLMSVGKAGLAAGTLVGIGLGIEDIVTMCQGGESVIGDFLDEMLGVEYRKQLVDQLNNAWDQMQPALAELKPIVEDVGLAFAKFIPYAIAGIVDLMKGAMAAGLAIKTLVNAVAGMADGKSTWGQIGDRFMKDSDAIFGSKGVLAGGSTLMNVINAPPTVSATESAGVRQPVSMVRGDNNISITVNGGPTNADTAKAVSKGVFTGIEGADKRHAQAALFQGVEAP